MLYSRKLIDETDKHKSYPSSNLIYDNFGHKPIFGRNNLNSLVLKFGSISLHFYTELLILKK